MPRRTLIRSWPRRPIRPPIGATNVKVVEVVLELLAHGWSPEEIHVQHRDLTLGQIHAALSRYYDHEDALDAEIARRSNAVRAIEDAHGDSPRRTRLRSLRDRK